MGALTRLILVGFLVAGLAMALNFALNLLSPPGDANKGAEQPAETQTFAAGGAPVDPGPAPAPAEAPTQASQQPIAEAVADGAAAAEEPVSAPVSAPPASSAT